MRRIGLSVLTCVLAVMLAASTGLAGRAGAGTINVLLITGDDIAPYHDWRDISEATRDVLVASERFNVRVCEEALILDSAAALKRYDVIVMTLYNRNSPTLTDNAKKNLLDFIASGKGLYTQHLASASFAEWKQFGQLLGRYWVMGKSGHGPRSVFTAKIANKQHPITRGMKDFKIFDELYSKLQGDGEIDVLVSAYSNFSKKEEPLVFTRPYGKGRTVHNALGHDFKAIRNKANQNIIRRAVEWAATGKVAE